MLQVRDNATTSILEYLNTGDDRNSADGEWTPFVTGLSTAILADLTVNKRRVMGFTAFNDTGTDNLLFCNGVENFSRASMAICRANGAIAAAAGTITVELVPGDPKANGTTGFPSSGSFVYKDTAGVITTVTYTGTTTTTFTGCSGATASADNTGIVEAADTTTHSSLTKHNILDTAQGRATAAGNDAVPNQEDLSRVGDFTDFTAGGAAADAQSLDFPDGGSSIALAHIDDWFFMIKEKSIWAFTFTPTTVEDGSGGSVATISTVRKRIARVGCASQKGVANVNDDVWFVTPTGQVRRLFRLEGERGFNTEDLVERIRPSLNGFVWDDASMEFFERERIVLVAGRSVSTVAINDKVVALQSSRLQDGSRIINLGIMDWFIGDMQVFNGQLFFGSSLESKNFKAFDGFAKDTAPYDWVRTERIETFPEIINLYAKKDVRYLGIEGTIATGCILNIKIDYDINGSTATSTGSLEGTDADYVVSQPLNTLNSFALNTEPLGGTRGNVSSRNPFFVVFALANEYSVRNVQLTFKTSGTGQDVEILSHGWVVLDSDDWIGDDVVKAIG